MPSSWRVSGRSRLDVALCGEDSFLGKANDQKEIRDGTSGVVPSPRGVAFSVLEANLEKGVVL